MTAGLKLFIAVFTGLMISFAGLLCDCLAAQQPAHENMSAHASHEMWAMPMDGMADDHQCAHGCDENMQTVSPEAVLALTPMPALEIDLALSAPQWSWQNENRLEGNQKYYAGPWHAPPDKTPVSLKIRLLT